MRLLVEIAAVCCVALVATALALWWNLLRAQRSPQTADPERAIRRAPNSRPHPRLDLAAGIAPTQQSVRTARNRRADRDAGPRTVSATREAAYAPRRDRAYFKGEFGDLSDPDVKRAAARAGLWSPEE